MIFNEEVMLNNSKNNLETNLYIEDSDEEWLKAKHRLLDGRIEYRNRLETISNMNDPMPTNNHAINRLNTLFDQFIDL